MNRLLLSLLTFAVLIPVASQAQISLDSGTTITFATAEEGRQVLTNRDDFVRTMSPFDRSARVKTDKDVSEAEFLKFVGKHNLEWTDDEKQKVAEALKPIQARLAAFALPFPKTIQLIKTTGGEDSNSPYTRANAIILPEATIAKRVDNLTKTLTHELFHVLSRANPQLRDRLYASIGFLKCDEVEFPAGIKARKITNPDAPANNHCVLLKVDDKDVWAVPIHYSRTERYEPDSDRSFFSYFELRLLIADRASPASKPAVSGPDTRLISLKDATGFFEQIGKNTTYIIHPEEILADNFALLIAGKTNVPSPEILKKIETILKPTK